MFNLEQEIKKWINAIRKNRSIEDGEAKELECHLRDIIENYIDEGEEEEKAFNKAIIEFGDSTIISDEYYKTVTTTNTARPSWKAPVFVPDLFWNYFKIGMRNIKKYSGHSFVNVLGLTIGLASVLLIWTLVQYETSFDDYHKNKDRIYRAYTEVNRSGKLFPMAPVMFPLAPEIEKNIPEIEHAVRLTEINKLVTYNDKKFYESILYADKNIFDVFSFPVKLGNASTALVDPYSIMLSEEMAEKYFGNENPIGKTLKLQNKDDYKVTGVFYDIPKNSHIRPKIFTSISTLYSNKFSRLESWTGFSNDYTYILLKPNVDWKIAQTKINDILPKHIEKEFLSRYKIFITPIQEIHFSNINYEFAKTTPKIYLVIFSIVAVFVLIIACINFINLTTAKSIKRNKEVGIRKTAGASRMQLVFQFLSESFLMVLISFFVSLLLVKLILPEANSLLNSNLSLQLLNNSESILLIISVLLFTAIISGGYPAFVLSSIKPAIVLKNAINKSKAGLRFRSALIVFQFSLSVFLIIGTITVYNQIDYLTSKDLGFKSDQILIIPIKDELIQNNFSSLKSDLLRNPKIKNVSFSNAAPGSGTSNTSNFNKENSEDNISYHMQVLEVDHDFKSTYELNIINGRWFKKEFVSDEEEAIIINQSAAKVLGYKDPLGERLNMGGEEQFRTIVGIIKDFHYSNLRDKIPPQIFLLRKNKLRFVSIQVSTFNTFETIEFIKKKIGQKSPAYPVEHFFLNERFERFYKAERIIGKLLSVFTILAVLISCIGILGLVSFVAEQKSKEIGIRKVLGASVTSILSLVVQQFFKWVILSNVIIWPIAYYLIDSWLNNFAYRIEINYLIFGITLVFSLVITLLTVAYHALKAAFSNPVDSLKYE